MPRSEDDDLDRALRRAGDLIATRTPELENELATLVVAARPRHSSARLRGPKRIGTIAAAGAVAVLLAGGAAAAASGVWKPWAETPDGSFTYTLPSGIECEERVAVTEVENAEVRAAVQSILQTEDVVAAAEPGAADWESRLRAEGGALDIAHTWVETGRTTLPTADDVIAQMAYSRAVNDVLTAELDERGLDTDASRNWIASRGQAVCTEGTQ